MDRPSYAAGLRALPDGERPREVLLRSGPERLADRDLIAILLGTGTRGESVLALADRVLARFGGLRGCIDASVEELSQVRGIGTAKGAQLKAALELGRRLAAASAASRPVVGRPADVASLVMEDMRYLDREMFKVVMLDTRHRVIGIQLVSVGHLSASLVHPRELFKDLIRRSSAAVILVHNHPSGDPQPSPEDVALTRRLVEAGELLGIEVLDHIVVGDNTYVSLKEQGFF